MLFFSLFLENLGRVAVLFSIAEDDKKNNVRSHNRKLDQSLLLIVKRKNEKTNQDEWIFPEKKFENETSLRSVRWKLSFWFFLKTRRNDFRSPIKGCRENRSRLWKSQRSNIWKRALGFLQRWKWPKSEKSRADFSRWVSFKFCFRLDFLLQSRTFIGRR